VKIKALSVWQPYAWLITSLPEPDRKNIENRTWDTNYRGWILVHAAKKMEDDRISGMIFDELGFDRVQRHQIKFQSGGFVGAVYLKDVIHQDNLDKKNPVHKKILDSRWRDYGNSPYLFMLEDAVPLPFIPWVGLQKLFNVNHAVILDRIRYLSNWDNVVWMRQLEKMRVL
jgi:hypothetical protein